MAVRVLAHFTPGPRVRDIVAAESDWLDVRFCADDDSPESLAAFHRELPLAEVIWHVLRPLSSADLRAGTRLRLVQKLGSGVNTIDVAAATARGIAVANMPGANAASVAEGAVGLMLAALRRMPVLDRAVRAGTGWPTDPTLGETVRDIGGCTVGLVGYGNVAKRVAAIVTAMSTDPNDPPDRRTPDRGTPDRPRGGVLHTSTGDDGQPGWRPLPELLADSDIVSLHLPLTDATRGLLNRDMLALMRPGAVLVNTARGEIVEEAALVDALRSGRLSAAGLDVFAREPVAEDNPLLRLDNVVLSPHVSWYTVDTMARYLAAAVANCRRLRDGSALADVVNQPTG